MDLFTEYRAAGWNPFPLPHGKKQPPPAGYTGRHGRDATNAEIAQWDTKTTTNIGLRMPPDVIGIDVDDYAGKGGAATLAAAELAYGSLPETVASTSRPGTLSRIMFFRVPGGCEWRSVLGEGVEIIQWCHRYAVVGPSLHPDGRVYAWLDGEIPRVEDLPELPAAWVEMLTRPAVQVGRERLTKVNEPDGDPCPTMAARCAKLVQEVHDPQGAHHDAMVKSTFELVRLAEEGHTGIEEALDLVGDAFMTYAPAQGRDLAGEYQRAVDGAFDKAKTSNAPGDPCDPVNAFAGVHCAPDLFEATPTLRHIRQAAHSRMLSAPALLGVVLARVLLEVPPEVCLPPVIGSRAWLNLGVAVTGPSGAGKSALLATSEEVLGVAQGAFQRNAGSGEGLAEMFINRGKGGKGEGLISDPRRLVVVDEIDAFGATKSRQGATIAPTLRSALTGGPLGQTNATPERNRHVPAGSYRLCMVVGVQPTRSGALLEDSDAGTPQRLVWLPAVDPTVPAQAPSYPGSLEWPLPPVGDPILGTITEVDYPDTIKQEVRAARHRQVTEGTDPLEGHKLLTRLKVATALAFLHGGAAITLQWWELAGQVIEMSMAEQAHCQSVLRDEAAKASQARGVGEAQREEAKAEYLDRQVAKHAATVWRAVVKHHTDQRHGAGEGCTMRCLKRAAHRSPDPSSAIDHAEDEGWIDQRGDRWLPGSNAPAGEVVSI